MAISSNWTRTAISQFLRPKIQFQSTVDPAYSCAQSEMKPKTPRDHREVRIVGAIGLEFMTEMLEKYR
jgi:hypothetical protein